MNLRDHEGTRCTKSRKSKNPRAVEALGFQLVTRRGFEPRTHCLKDSFDNKSSKIEAHSTRFFSIFVTSFYRI